LRQFGELEGLVANAEFCEQCVEQLKPVCSDLTLLFRCL
jgi:hypothetical protein